jgi:putative transcriptional regulator
VEHWSNSGGEHLQWKPGEIRSTFAFRYRVGSVFVSWGNGHWIRGELLEVQLKNRLRVLRAEREWSQADLAERLEISRQSINAIETGKYDPSLPLAFKIARLFSTTIEAIFTDEIV